MKSPTTSQKQYPRCRRMLVNFGMGASKSVQLETDAAQGNPIARKWIMTVWQLDRGCVIRPTIFHNRDLFLTMKEDQGVWSL